jgi:hypothetical protein
MSFVELTNWLLYSGGINLVISGVLEKWTWFQYQSSNVKWWISKALIVGSSLGLYVLVTYLPSDILVQLETYFKVAFGVLVVNGGTEVYHQRTK